MALLHQAVAAKAPYSVAIIDMQMPGMGGSALVRKINAEPLLSDDLHVGIKKACKQ